MDDAGRTAPNLRPPASNLLRVHLWIEGRVQGVNFRYYTQREATRLGVKGWVRNLPDGRVEALLEGEPAAVQRLVEWCRHGPPGASVRRVEERREEPTGEFTRFEIERTPYW